jgi:uncharacterized membrane protein YoaK (UPF0700 family)
MFRGHLPRWILIGGALLACIAGQVNAVGVLSAFHEALTHVTGTVTRAAVDLEAGAFASALHAIGIVVAFIAGAVLAGVVVGQGEIQRGQRYSIALLIEAALLLVGAWLLHRGSAWSEAACAAAAGLQNGLVTTWSGAIVRTSHVTGVATDVGLALGYWARSRLGKTPAAHTQRLALHLCLLGGFFGGGVIGAFSWARVGALALVLPALLCVLAAVLYANKRVTGNAAASP